MSRRETEANSTRSIKLKWKRVSCAIQNRERMSAVLVRIVLQTPSDGIKDVGRSEDQLRPLAFRIHVHHTHGRKAGLIIDNSYDGIVRGIAHTSLSGIDPKRALDANSGDSVSQIASRTQNAPVSASR